MDPRSIRVVAYLPRSGSQTFARSSGCVRLAYWTSFGFCYTKVTKSEDYYNTKIALKTDLKEDLDFLSLLESKSYDVNINQNYLLYIDNLFL